MDLLQFDLKTLVTKHASNNNGRISNSRHYQCESEKRGTESFFKTEFLGL